MENKNKILIIAAHPDDEVLGCGGTIAKHSHNNEVYVVILGEGISSRYAQREDVRKEELLSLQKQSKEAGRFLGAKENIFFNLPDNQFDSIPLLKIVKKIEEVIKKIRPAIVYTHHSGDLNIDHRITFQAVLTATRPIDNCSVKKIYSFEIPSSTEWSFQKINGPFLPNVFEDISETWEKKVQAMQMYNTEIKKFPHPRSKEAIVVIAKRWGSTVGLKYAEAFELIRAV
ncbi:PIG-L deacetylase family protein [Patescibacteria group bacterium]